MLEAPLPAQSTTPTSSYLICSGQRSGTWLLSGLLDSTGVAGHPHEYFEVGTERANRARWAIDSLDDYLAAVLTVGTSANGVFGASVMLPNFTGLLDRIREPAESDVSALERIFHRPRFVFLWREDVIAQAVSWSRAAQTGYYHWDTARGEATFDPDQIGALIREASENAAAWHRWFQANDVEPLEVRFEDLVREKEGTARTVLEFVGVDAPEAVTFRERTVETPEAADDWVERYRSRTRAGGPPSA